MFADVLCVALFEFCLTFHLYCVWIMQTINNDDLEEIRELGSGTYGSVYHGKWRGCDVAIKRIKASCFAGRPSERERLVCFFWLVPSTLETSGSLHSHCTVLIAPSQSFVVFSEQYFGLSSWTKEKINLNLFFCAKLF